MSGYVIWKLSPGNVKLIVHAERAGHSSDENYLQTLRKQLKHTMMNKNK